MLQFSMKPQRQFDRLDIQEIPYGPSLNRNNIQCFVIEFRIKYFHVSIWAFTKIYETHLPNGFGEYKSFSYHIINGNWFLLVYYTN